MSDDIKEHLLEAAAYAPAPTDEMCRVALARIKTLEAELAALRASAVAEPVAWRVDGIRDGKQQVWFYWKPEWPGMHEEQGDMVAPLYAHPAPAAPVPAIDRCAKCGEPRKEHAYNGACYGVCGEFVAAASTLTADFTKALPGGTLDNSTYEQIETALDRADAPMTDKGRFMTLFERIAALGAERDAALSPAAPKREDIIEQCAKVCGRWIRSKNLHESLAATGIAKAILALKTAPAK